MRVPDVLLVEGGRFAMGSERGRPDEAPVHEVQVGAFRLGRTPITNAEYAACVAAGRVAEPPVWRDAAFSADDRPVVGVSWFEASAFCDWLTEVTSACWRLPTEAEWECAARGGLRSAPTAWGDSLPEGEVPAGPLAGPWSVATRATQRLRTPRRGHDRPRVVRGLVRREPTTRSRQRAGRPVRMRARGVPAAAARGATACAGRLQPPAAACRRSSTTPTTGSGSSEARNRAAL